MSKRRTMLEGFQYAQHLRVAADAMEDAQRARQHLWGIITYWEASTENERLDSVCAAYNRLNRLFELQGGTPTYYREDRAEAEAAYLANHPNADRATARLAEDVREG